MSDKQPEEFHVTIGNKQVPVSAVNKPHNVVVGGQNKPVVDASLFPEVEPEAKAREAQLEAERAQKKSQH